MGDSAIAALLVATNLVLSALGPEDSESVTDAYAECGFYHWSSLVIAREQTDLDAITRHLAELNGLARALAIEMRVSVDGAHTIIRRTGEEIAATQGVGIFSISNARKRCARLQRSLSDGVAGAGA